MPGILCAVPVFTGLVRQGGRGGGLLLPPLPHGWCVGGQKEGGGGGEGEAGGKEAVARPQDRGEVRGAYGLSFLPAGEEEEEEETSSLPSSSQLQYIDKVVFVVAQRHIPMVRVVEVPQFQFVGSVVAQRQIPDSAYSVEVRQLHLSKVVDIPVVTQSLIPMVQTVLKTIVIPQLQYFDMVFFVPGVRVVQVSLVKVVEETVVLPQLQLVGKIVVIPEVLAVCPVRGQGC